MDWDSRSPAALSARGALDDAKSDAGYTVELAIPWQAFSLDGGMFSPPRVDERWRFNVDVMDLGRDRQRAAAWSPLGVGDFHVPQRFGILQFEGTPEEMMGRRAPIEIPEGRLPAPMRRGGVDPAVRDSLIQQRAYQRRPFGAAREADQEPQRLESSGAAH